MEKPPANIFMIIGEKEVEIYILRAKVEALQTKLDKITATVKEPEKKSD